ncbi:hypothetical protein HOY82DRAFT_608276 [Tuber indicum]|nr:hypothetical protein HOY82DRAFT_608276 [Tuber indicum]
MLRSGDNEAELDLQERQALLRRSIRASVDQSQLFEETRQGLRIIHQEEALTKSQLWGMYLSHSLSTWNSRRYEFAAILFAASAYPGNLTASSIRFVQTLTLRLETLQLLGGHFLVNGSPSGHDATPRIAKVGHDVPPTEAWIMKAAVMATIVALDLGERLSAVGNMLIMERDWVPTLVTPTSDPPLYVLNASMRHIDLISKLVAPIFVSLAATFWKSQRVTAFGVAGMNAVFMVPEWSAARKVWLSCSRLRENRLNAAAVMENEGWGSGVASWATDFKVYFGSNAWILMSQC